MLFALALAQTVDKRGNVRRELEIVAKHDLDEGFERRAGERRRTRHSDAGRVGERTQAVHKRVDELQIAQEALFFLYHLVQRILALDLFARERLDELGGNKLDPRLGTDVADVVVVHGIGHVQIGRAPRPSCAWTAWDVAGESRRGVQRTRRAVAARHGRKDTGRQVVRLCADARRGRLCAEADGIERTAIKQCAVDFARVCRRAVDLVVVCAIRKEHVHFVDARTQRVVLPVCLVDE